MKLRQIDMHWHSIYSDGKVTPRKGVKILQKAGIRQTTPTDHDTIKGISQAIRATKDLHVKPILPYNAEFTAKYENATIHILGYCFHLDNKLDSYFALQEETKENYIEKIVDLLNQFNLNISTEEIFRLTPGTVRDAHFYEAVVSHPENLGILREYDSEKFKNFNNTFLKEKIITFEKKKLPVKQIIKMIRNAGGYAVWAHPFWKKNITIYNVQEKAEIFRDMGLNGIEVFYYMHDQKATFKLHEIVQQLSTHENPVYHTVGSDSHFRDENKSMNAIHFYGIREQDINFFLPLW